MLWSDRRQVLAGLLACLPLCGCGFAPVYGPEGTGVLLRDQVRIEAPDTRLEFELVTQLETRIGRTDAAPYQLSYGITTNREGIAISETNDITRFRVNGRVRYTLANSSGDPVLSGEVDRFTAYSTTGSTLASDAGARDADARLMVMLADGIVDALIAGLARDLDARGPE